jgi:lipopolysaccharide assembly protein A
MRTLKLLILIIIALLALFLVMLNIDEIVPLSLPGAQAKILAPLGLLLLGAFLAGLLPTMIWYKLSRWRVRRKLTRAEAKLQAGGPAAPTPADPESSLLARARAAGGAAGYAGDLPAQARPMSVPPAGA